MSRYLLGLDNGGTSVKAVLFDAEGRVIAKAGRNIPLAAERPGWAERDMEALWDANCGVIRETIRSAGIDAGDIVGVSLCGHGKGLYLWGADGKPVRPGIVSTDARAARIAEAWRRDGTAAKARETTCQSVLASQPVSLLKWLDAHEPEARQRAQWVFGVKDYLRFRMTGEAYGEITDMSGSNLVNLRTAAYDRGLLALFGLDGWWDMLPPLKYSTEACGRVTAACAARTGLAEGTLVAAGLFDIDACAVAMDVTDASRVAVIAGTWSINEFVSPRPVLDGGVKMNSLFCLPGSYLVEECSPTSASNHEWYCRLFMGEAADFPYEAANAQAASVAPDACDAVFLPYLFGGDENEFARASLVGLSAAHTKAQVTRTIYEGIAFCHKRHVDKLLANLAERPVVRMAGGAVKSPFWVQLFADVLELPVETIDVDESGALGAAMAAGVAAGLFPDLRAAIAAMVRVGDRVEPDEATFPAYRRKYARWRRVADALDPLWEGYAQ